MQNELPKVAVPLVKGKAGFLVVGTDRKVFEDGLN